MNGAVLYQAFARLLEFGLCPGKGFRQTSRGHTSVHQQDLPLLNQAPVALNPARMSQLQLLARSAICFHNANCRRWEKLWDGNGHNGTGRCRLVACFKNSRNLIVTRLTMGPRFRV